MIKNVSNFCDRLKEAMEIRDIKAIELSNKTGISQATISQYKSGYAVPKRNKLKILSDTLNVNPTWLLGLDVAMDPADEIKENLVNAYIIGGKLQEIGKNPKAVELAYKYLKLSTDDQKYMHRLIMSLPDSEQPQQQQE